jgi:hypothetical protein
MVADLYRQWMLRLQAILAAPPRAAAPYPRASLRRGLS